MLDVLMLDVGRWALEALDVGCGTLDVGRVMLDVLMLDVGRSL